MPNGLLDGIRAANMQTANYMTDCCMEEEVIRDVVQGIDDCLLHIFRGDVKEVPPSGLYQGGSNTPYVENFLMGFCEEKRRHLELLQQELIPADVIKLIIAKGTPAQCRSDLLSIIMTKSWNDLAKEFIIKVGDQEDFPQILLVQIRAD